MIMAVYSSISTEYKYLEKEELRVGSAKSQLSNVIIDIKAVTVLYMLDGC